MANIDIKLSQSAINTNHSLDLKSVSSSGDVNSLINAIIKLDEDINSNYYYYSSYTLTSNTVSLRYSDNTKITLTGTLDNPNSYYGYSTVTKQTVSIPAYLNLSATGTWRYYYDSYGSLSFNAVSGTLTTADYKSLVADPDFGKIGISLKGSVSQNFSTDNLSGTLTSINMSATKFISSASINGNFTISGNAHSIAAGSTSISISGTLSSYNETYIDGSYVKVNGSLNYNGSTEIGYALLSDASNFSGDDTIKLILPTTIYDDINIASGLGNDTITIEGGGSHLNINAGAGNDVISLKGGYHYANGGTDNDTYIINNETDTIAEDSDAGTDTVQSSISYTLANNFENLTLTGTASINGTGNSLDNSFTGNKSANVLNGAAGNDTLTGGLGSDILTGGDGNDVFIFNTTLNAKTNLDTITDFISGSDEIQLSKAIFKGVAETGNLSDAAFYVAADAVKGHDVDDRIIYNTTTGALYYDADGSGKGAAIQVALIGSSSHPTLAYTDIQVIA